MPIEPTNKQLHFDKDTYMKLLFVVLACTLSTITAGAQSLPRVAPEQVGMNARHLSTYADAAINQAVAQKEIPGAVLAVVRQGKLAYLKAYGNKQVYPTTERMEVNTIFDIASCSKSISTAISTMILVERGQLRLTDRVSFYLPAFEGWVDEQGKKTEIRVIDLMTHTSGLPPYAHVVDLEKKYGSPHPEGLLTYISTCKRDFKPQTDFQYSCLNYIALQHIIETISGQTLRNFAKVNIFDVLGMTHTDYLPTLRQNNQWVTVMPSSLTPLIAPTQKQPDGSVLCGQVHDPLARIMNGGISGNAGVFSDANDIALLVAALQNGGEHNGKRILSPLSVKTMRTIPRSTSSFGRTPGWDVSSPYASNNGDLFGPNTYGHTGYTGTSIIIDPDNDTSVILLTNRAHPEDKGEVVRLRSLVANAVAGAIYPTQRLYSDHYYHRFLEFENEPLLTEKDIVMLGNSLTEGGGDWNDRLHTKKRVCNRGISGDEAMGLLDRLHQILPARPAKLFLMIGINDLSHQLTPDSVVSLITRVIDRIQTDSPHTRLYVQSLLPINESLSTYKTMVGKTELIPEINAKLETATQIRKVTFINLFPLFCEKGTNILRPELTRDGLHLTEEGYRIWSKSLKRHL